MAGALHHRGPDEFGVYRDGARRPGARAAVDHRPRHRPAAAVPTRTRRSGSSSTARSSTTSSCAPSSRRSATASAPAATPRSSSTPTRRGATRRSRASTASGRSRCGTRRGGGWCSPATASACGRSTSASTRGRLYFASEVKAIFAADAVDPARASIRSASTRPSRSGRRCAPRTRVRRRRRAASPAHVRTCRSDGPASPSRGRAGEPSYPETPDDEFQGSLDDAVGGGPRRARAGDARCACCAPTCRSAATSRAGSTARSSRRSACAAKGDAVLRPSRCASRTPSTTRREYQRADGRAPRQRAPRGRRHRARDIADVLSRRDLPHRAPDPAHRAGAAVPAVAAGARARHQGRADRRRRRRDVRRLRPVPRGARCAASGPAQPSSTLRPRLLERLYPYLARSPVAQQAMARQFFGQQPRRRGARPASATTRAGRRPAR